MNRADYAYRALAAADYEAIVTASEMDGGTSPMHGAGNWQALLTQSQNFNIDPRLALAAALWEDHDGTDPNGGVTLAKVYNFSGIKWAGQSYAYDSGIPAPANEGGTYAGFRDFGGWCQAVYMTLTNGAEGPYFNGGDLLNAWSVYITGKPGSTNGQGRIDSMVRWQQQYPAPGGTTTDGVYGEDLIAKFETQIGQAMSGTYDALNGNHPWAYWCRAGVESTGRDCGLTVVAHASAYAAQLAAAAQGLLVTDGTPPEHGAVVQLDTTFYAPDGHTGLWNATKGQLLCTLTDGTGVGYRAWGPGTTGYAGWYRLPGIVAPYRVAPPQPGPQPSANLVIPGNPYNANVTDPMHQIGVGGANRRLWESTPYALQMLGWPMRNEQPAMVYEANGTSKQRTVQYYERVVTIYAPEQNVPWDITVALATQRIIPIGG